MAFSTRICLYDMMSGKGVEADKEVPTHEVWANVTLPSVSLQLKAMSEGYAADLQADMWREEYGGESRVQIDNVRYRVISVSPLHNEPLKLRLLLSREG